MTAAGATAVVVPVRRAEQIGWLMFMASAIFFGWSGVRAGDWLVVAGSVVFGLACVLFLLPHDHDHD